MLTLGIDLASSPKDTAICSISWTAGKAIVCEIKEDVEDSVLLTAINQAEKAGIDIPLGWPDEFVEAIASHHAFGPWPNNLKATLRYRETDREVQSFTGRQLLSVSSDRIAVPAMRAAALLSTLRIAVDRTGNGKIVEVYPVVALHQWGFGHPSYKRSKNYKKRRQLVDAFEGRTAGWLQWTQRWRSLCEKSDHAFDAVLSALVARAKAQGLCAVIPPGAISRASREGWIAVPDMGSLHRLV